MVERWFGELSTKLLRRGVHLAVAELTRSISTWIDTWNEAPPLPANGNDFVSQ